MKSLLRGVRPLDYVLAAGMTALGILLMRENMHGQTGKTRIDSTTWVMIPVFLAVTLPILWRRINLSAVLGVTAAALVVHDIAFGWVVRCGAGLPLAFALSYAVGRLITDRKQSYWALAATFAIQFLVLVRDSAAGLGVMPFTVVIAAAFWGVGLYVQKRSQCSITSAAAYPVALEDVQLARAAK
jgi:hypothetical protein